MTKFLKKMEFDDLSEVIINQEPIFYIKNKQLYEKISNN